ncbi:GPI-anchored surface protein, putative [Bodo saltans]|uniref:GPI-anchored surface protein, putative n=1 Tax=Bodo saltans TaxID=75058 RepID=A0A0S4JHY7_BODSA|nr:GPI-anchored surface protein, putative [Bodo saltans]|eukprot:CUG91078.1 GPI-anchored surface protein, putative [Bodo saltans]
MLRRTFRRLSAAPTATSLPKGEVHMSTARGATGGNDSSLDKLLVVGACGAVIAWQAFGPEVIAHH